MTLLQTNHFHQSDAIMIIPVETFLQTTNKWNFNYADLYLLNTKVVLQFLHKLGLNNAYDFDSSYCKSEIQRLGPDYLDFKKEYSPDPEQ